MTTKERLSRLEVQFRLYRNLVAIAGLVIVAVLAYGCAATGSVCQTAYGNCRASSAGKSGNTCVCHYQYWAHPGVLR